MADQTYDQWQFPDPPGNYPAPVAFVLRKLNEERPRADAVNAAIAAEKKERLANFASASNAILENKTAIKANASAITSVKSDLSEVYNDAAQAISDASSAQSAIDKHKDDKSNPHKVTAAQLGALTAESDPVFAAWKGTTNGCFTAGGNIELHDRYDHIAFGYDIYAEDDGGGTDGYYYQSVAFGKNLELGKGAGTSGIAFGRDIYATFHGVFIGRHIKVAYTSPSAVAIGYATPDAPLVANGKNTFNITTPDPAHFWFNSVQGSTARTLQSYLDERATTNDLAAVKATIPVISATDAIFSNAVLAVGLNIDTNSVAQINELLTDGAKLPTSGVATVGGLLAALAAGLAALKKSVSSLSSKVDDANAALEEVA